MPRIANTTTALLADLQRRLAQLAETAHREGRDEALAEIRSLVGGGGGGGGGGRRKAATATADSASDKPKKKRKNPWATMTPKQKADRVRKMLAGRGLTPKSERGGSKKATRRSKK